MEEPMVRIPQTWEITYDHPAGRTASRFFTELKDQRHLLGKRCPSCRRVLMPPRAFCDRCYVPTEEWVQVADTGVIEAFTIVANKFQGLPDPPYALVYVRLDGAETAIANTLQGVDLSDIEEAARRMAIGTPVTVKYKEPAEGRVTDFWFEIA